MIALATSSSRTWFPDPRRVMTGILTREYGLMQVNPWIVRRIGTDSFAGGLHTACFSY
jgi:hypothetical protein